MSKAPLERHPNRVANNPEVIAVTVTYGNRWNRYGSDLAQRVFEEGAARLIVVYNASGEVPTPGDSRVSFVAMGSNRGTAAAFSRGLEVAVSLGAQLVWVLDDDNLPRPGCLEAQIESLLDHRGLHPSTLGAVSFALRPGQRAQRGLTRADMISKPPCEACQYAGFDVIARMSNFFRSLGTFSAIRLRNVTPVPQKTWQPTLRGMWGGMLISSDAIRSSEAPDVGFVLYADDTDYSRKLRRAGFELICSLQAVVDDVGDSGETSPSLRSVLRSENYTRMFYVIRNRVILERRSDSCGWEFARRTVNGAIWRAHARAVLVGQRWKHNRRVLAEALRCGNACDFSVDHELMLTVMPRPCIER